MKTEVLAASAGATAAPVPQTLAGLYGQRLRLAPAAPACRSFDEAGQCWRDTSWQELAALAGRYADGLRRLRLAAGERVAIQLDNGPAWLALDWACAQLGLVTVGLFVDDTAAGTAQILLDSGARVLFVREAADWAGRANGLASRALPALREVVFERGSLPPPGDRRLHKLSDWLAHWLGAAGPLPEALAQPVQLASIVYTSGSTGTPRGVMLSHRNLVANVVAVQQALDLRDDDRLFSILPMAHLFGRSVGAYLGILAGAVLVFGRGAAVLAEDLASRQPTVLIGVPRLYERIYGDLLTELDAGSASRRTLFRLAVAAGCAARHKDAGPLKVSLLPTRLVRSVGSGLRDRLGGRVRLAVSGGAGLSPEIARVFIGLGIPLLRGYGLTEAGPVVSVNPLHDPDLSSEGLALSGVETRTDASGELCVRGPSVMLGYWNDAPGTAAVLDADGWLRTGDKVSRLDTQRLHLVGRIKDVLVTATGEKASASLIEARLRALPLIEQVMVVGEARPYLAALVVAQSGGLALLRAQLGLVEGDDSDAARKRIEQVLLEQCQALLGDAPRSQWIVRVGLVTQPWTFAHGLVTASGKLRRCEIERTHPAEIQALYAGHYIPPPTDCARNASL